MKNITDGKLPVCGNLSEAQSSPKVEALENLISGSHALERVFSVLGENAFEAYLVGGCVRNALMGLAAGDFDVCTSALPEQVKECFRGERVILTGEKHGTVTVVIDRVPIEITTFRTDGEYLDGRHPKAVGFSRELDLSRRDFTVNAMAYARSTRLIDLFGGRADIENKLIRCVGEPEKRFDEDALRILRALRFAAVLDFEIEEKTLAAARLLKANLLKLSAERVREELRKLIMGKAGVRVLRECSDIVFTVLPELRPCYRFNQHNPHHIYDVFEHTLHAVECAKSDFNVRFTLLLHDSGKPKTYSVKDGRGHFYGHAAKSVELAEQVMNRLKFDNATKAEILTLIEHHDARISPDVKSVGKWLNKIGAEYFDALIEVKRCDAMAQNTADYPERLLEVAELRKTFDLMMARGDCYCLKMLKINGDELKKMGLKGEQIGKMLNSLLSRVIEGELINDNGVLVAAAQKSIAKHACPL